VSVQFVETHAHLDSGEFSHDRDRVIHRAAEAGVVQIITVGADLASSEAAVALAEQHPSVYATVGIHPHDAASVKLATLTTLRDLATHPKVVAIGEIGLDFYRNYAPHDIQYAVFRRQLDLAAEIGKPVVVHIRDKRGEKGAYGAASAALDAWLDDQADSRPGGQSPGVLHCYSGDLETAKEAIRLGFYLGIDGPVTYSSAKGLQSLVSRLPLESLVLETDCPFLAPQVRRGKRNEPSYIPHIARKVAELKRVSVGDVAQVTSANARRLFGLPDTDRQYGHYVRPGKD
jgi:TatD DNase family protein